MWATKLTTNWVRGYEADTEAARASERSGKQYLLDALGSFFTASEEVNVCIFCVSTRHAHDECEDPKKGDLKKALVAIRTALEGESSGSDVDMEQEGGQEKKDESKGPAEPDKARTGKYHWYDESRLMSEVGVLDEAGRFCIDGCDIVCEGPQTRYDLDDVIRDAVMRGGGDTWKVPDFLAAYNDQNLRKPLYQRAEAPLDGFLKIVPYNGCYFHIYKFYNGVEYGYNYTFGHNNKLSDYEEDVSSSLNRILRHQVAKVSVSVRALFVMTQDGCLSTTSSSARASGGMTEPGLRTPFSCHEERLTKSIGISKKLNTECRRSSRSCFTVRDMDEEFASKSSPLASTPTLIERVRPVGVTTCNNVSVATDIPEEGLLLYPVAVRAPTGHGDTRGSNDVVLKSTLLSRPIAPSTVVSMPACFHITLAKHLKSIWREGLIPGGLNASSRFFTFFNPYVPWDLRSWKATKSVDTRRGGYVCLYVPTEVLMNEFNGRL